MTAALDLFSYPQSPGWKARDTAREAASAVASVAGGWRGRVLAEIVASGQYGLTADQVAGRLGRSIMMIRPRVSELVELGKLRDTGKRRANESGKPAIVWAAR